MKNSESVEHKKETNKAILFAIIFFAIIAIATYFAWKTR